MKFAFFGSSKFSVFVLEELKRQNIMPDLLVTTPDKPKGRKLISTPNSTKEWAVEKGLEFIEFKNLKDPAKNNDGADAVKELSKTEWDLFLVASYGKIIPRNVFEIPKFGTLNIHPSLLPKYRGASPIVSQILNDEKETGVSIMQIDEGMDTGPVLMQEKVEMEDWPIERGKLEKILAEVGAKMFVEITPKWIKGEIKTKPQDDSKATTCGKIKKEDGLIDLNDDPYKNLLKIKAYQGWPTTYFFFDRRSLGGGSSNKIRIIITDATIENDGSTNSPQAKLKILKVIPEGKREMTYDDFLRGNRTNL